MTISLRKSIDGLTIVMLTFVTFSIAITQAALFLAVILMIFLYKKDLLQRIKEVDINLPLILFFLAAVTSLLFFVEPVKPLKGAIRLKYFLLFISYYYFFFHRLSLPTIKKYYYIIISAFFLVLVFIILQRYLGEEILPYRYSTFQWNSGNRIYPLYAQFSSIILMLILPVLLFAKSLSKKEKILHIIIMLPILLTLYLSFSRTSVISVTAAFCFLMYFRDKKVYVLVVLLAVLAAGIYYTRKNESNLFTSLINVMEKDNVRYESDKYRVKMLEDSYNIFKAHPITGIGFYGYKYYSAALKREHSKIFNDYLHVLATMGLIGLLPFLWLIFALFKGSWVSIRLLKSSPISDDFYANFSFGVFVSFISFLINAVFEPVFFNSETLILMLLLLSMNKVIITERWIEGVGG